VTRGAKGSEPAGIAGDCFLVLAMYVTRGGGLTALDLQALIARENSASGWPVPDRGQVRRALHDLARRAPPLVARSTSGRWWITRHGYAMLAAWCGDDDGPVPCGLGWPDSRSYTGRVVPGSRHAG
jgi:hypothetical protein